MSQGSMIPLTQGLSSLTGMNIATYFGAVNKAIDGVSGGSSGSSMPYVLNSDGLSRVSVLGLPIITFTLIAATTVILAFVTISENKEAVSGITNSVNSSVNDMTNSVTSSVNDSVSSIGSFMPSPVTEPTSSVAPITGGKRSKKNKSKHKKSINHRRK
jgi:hypothetical protein